MFRHDPRRGRPHARRRRTGTPAVTRLRPTAEPVLKRVFAKIGRPEASPFRPDDFQLRAVEAVREGDCIVTAPTGSGKTWIAEEAIRNIFTAGGRCWYASPLKALSNAKWVEFGERFGESSVGILTGDTKENTDAPILVGTTEILRNQLYDAMHRGEDLPCDLVVLDEAHYLGDRDRGVVWEEIMIYLPRRINLLLLSATVGNADEIASWLSRIREKPCRVIHEDRRPVPLYPLVLHPEGRIMPLLEKEDLYGKVRSLVEGGATHSRLQPPRFGEILEVMRKYRLLPAIFFLKSRSECDGALKSCPLDRGEDEDEAFHYELEGLLARFPYLADHRHLPHLERGRVASHHGGQLPAWKFLVETMMRRGHLDAIFATSTVAAGVNYPARTIVLFNSDIFNGRDFAPLTGTEFHQMTGRAGRRGLDRIGFLMVVPGRFMNIRHIRDLLCSGADDIRSQIRPDFSMVLNLLLSQTPADMRHILERSLAVEQARRRVKDGRSVKGDLLWRDFLRYLSFLKAEGFVDDEGRLTENGLWAAKLRLDHPLLIAECIKSDAFPADPSLLAAVIAPFVYDGDQDMRPRDKRRPARLLAEAFETVLEVIEPLADRMEKAGFTVNPLFLWPAQAVYDWSRGSSWDDVVRRMGVADGDMAMLVLRTADNLRQIASLKDTHPDLARRAAEAVEIILREPVLFGEGF